LARWRVKQKLTANLLCVYFERSYVVEEKLTNKKWIHKIVVNGLRETIRIHGPIGKKLIGSAAKRIIGMLSTKERKG
jgi:hypothetical protein